MWLQAINQKLNNFIAFVKANNSNNLFSPALLYVGNRLATASRISGGNMSQTDIFICNGSLAEVIYDFDVILFPVSSLGRLSLW